MRKVKWGVIGCGGIADRRTLPGMMLADNAECVAVMDASLEVAQRVKEKYGAKYAFNNYEELLSLFEVEAVYIASPVFAHKEQALAAARAGKHILIEKPIGLSLDESYEIIDACESAGVKLGVGLMMRYHGYHQLMKKEITLNLVEEVMKDFKLEKKKNITPELILDTVAKHYNLKMRLNRLSYREDLLLREQRVPAS